MASRTWIKIYCDKWINGTIREETPELRGIWVDLLALAGSGKYGDSGEVKITDRVGYLDKQLASLLQISVQKWVTCKKKLIQTDRVCVKNGNIIVINNWSKYQSEYQRQKPSRQRVTTSESEAENCNSKLQPEVTPGSAALDKEIRDRDNKRIENGDGSCCSIEDALETYEKNIGHLTEDMENEVKTAVTRFSAQWVVDAIREARKHNKATWVYVAGILKNWQRYGKGAAPPGKGAIDPEKYIRGQRGHMVQR